VEPTRRANRQRILETIIRRESVSRTELARIAGLAQATVSDIVAELIVDRLVLEDRLPASGRGRPRMRLHVNPQGPSIGGVFLSPDGQVDMLVTDLRGEPSLETRFHIAPCFDGRALAPQLAEGLVAAIGEARLATLLAIGVSVNAAVQTPAGLVHWTLSGDAEAEPMQAMLEQRLGIAAHVDNVANIIGRSLRWTMAERSDGETCVIIVGPGIGMCRLQGGVVQNGADGFNPEFGHVKLGAAGETPCYCGASGCLAAVASIFGLLSQAGQRWSEQFASQFDQLANRALGGDERARALFHRAGRALGSAVANHINACSPAEIAIVSMSSLWSDLARAGFEAQLRADTLPLLHGRAPISFRSFSPELYVRGAIALVLDRLHETG